jgi:uncharacterized repeat protein (TIGR03803 family)
MRRALIAILAVTFSITAHAQSVSEQLIYSFCEQPACADGAEPTYGMAQLSNGSFVVATDGAGEIQASGSIVMFTPTGQGSDYSATVLAEFCSSSPTACPDGSFPVGTPIEGLDGNIYFVNQVGGLTTYNSQGSGILWRYSPPYGDSLLESQFYDFCSDTNCAAGGTPGPGLTQGTDTALYGTTTNNGSTNGTSFGDIVRVDMSGNITSLHSFCHGAFCADGADAVSLLQAADGNFYGSAYSGGQYGYGVVFEMTPTGNYTVLHSFCSAGTGCPDGGTPIGSLVQADNGNIYGVTSSGGNSSGGGTVYYIDTSGAFHTYLDFGCIIGGTACVNGYSPVGGLILGSDGNLYGTTTITSTRSGGPPHGAAFQLPLNDINAPATNIFYYCAAGSPCLDGSTPAGEFVVGADGNLYGVFAEGGTNGQGAAYLLTTSSFLQPPVQLTLSATSGAANTPVTLSWIVPYAYSKTAQLCGASVQNDGAGAGNWSGLQTGTYANHAYSGSSVITPTVAGTYTYALTCGGKESGFATLSVTSGLSATATSLNVTPALVTVGQSATLTATVSSSAGTPAGSVTFYYGTEALATVSLTSGVASLHASTNGLPPTTYGLTAKYSGNSNYSSSSGSDSVTLAVAPTATALTASPTTVTPPADVTLTATVKRSASGAAGTPTGSVTFYANGTDALATVKLNSTGVAFITASSKGYPAGKYSVTAKYLGDFADTTSTSAAVNVTLK